jgi:integrating conjugative element protein (TIGR03752 family)
LDTATTRTGDVARGVGERIEQAHKRPVYTVPRNATLIGSTAMTALVGRVPVQGQVRDPMPFKIITGADNLAANGLTVPGVQGMVWSGTAVGDWTLSCVTGRLDSVTFVFDDGTIRTLSSDDRQTSSGGTDAPLGWISDAQGIPCVSGERKTNAPAFLAQRMGVMALQAAGQAAAAAETTSIIGEAGGITNSVTGDTGTFVLGKTVAGGSDELAKWLLERQSQSFDAVFVPAGTRLAIHVDRELPIDLNPNGRRLQHASAHEYRPHPRLD